MTTPASTPAIAVLPSLPRAPPLSSSSSLGTPWLPPHAAMPPHAELRDAAAAATGTSLATSLAASPSAPRLDGAAPGPVLPREAQAKAHALRTLAHGDSAPALRHILRSTWVPTKEAERSGKEEAPTSQEKRRAPGAGVGAGEGEGVGEGEGAPATATALASLGRGWLAVQARIGPGPGVAAVASTESGGTRGLKVDTASGCYLNVPSIVPPAWMELFEADQI